MRRRRAARYVALALGAASGLGVACSTYTATSDAPDGSTPPGGDAGGGDATDAGGEAATQADGAAVVPELLVAAKLPIAIAASASFVYWAEEDDGTIHRIPLAGPPNDQVFLSLKDPQSIAIVGTKILVADHNLAEIVAANEGVPNASAPIISGIPVKRVAATATRIWWIDSNSAAHTTDILGTGLSDGPTGGALTDIAVNDSTAFWTASSASNIVSSPIGSMSPGILQGAQVDVRAIAATATAVYWTLGDAASIVAKPIGQGMKTLVKNAGQPVALAVDDAHLYWLSEKGLYRAGLDGNNQQRLGDAATGSHPAFEGIAVTPSAVYWIDLTGPRIMRVAK